MFILVGLFDVFLRVIWAPEEGSTATAKATSPPPPCSHGNTWTKSALSRKKKKEKEKSYFITAAGRAAIIQLAGLYAPVSYLRYGLRIHLVPFHWGHVSPKNRHQRELPGSEIKAVW